MFCMVENFRSDMMDFNTLKDTNNLKSLVSEMGKDIVEAFKSVKNVNAETFKRGFNTYFVDYLKNNYANFNGRISRRQYWMFALYSVLISFALNIVIMILPFLAVLSLIYALALLVPSFSLIIRRLHDINLSGWFLLISIVPVLGALALLFLLCMPSDKGENKFGTEVK